MSKEKEISQLRLRNDSGKYLIAGIIVIPLGAELKDISTVEDFSYFINLQLAITILDDIFIY